jgi:long-subunit acyl-CoA synthetase (AMP-forming)
MYSERDYLGVRPVIDDNPRKRGAYRYVKFKDVGELVTYFASGLRCIGLETQDKVGIMAKNCLEWV